MPKAYASCQVVLGIWHRSRCTSLEQAQCIRACCVSTSEKSEVEERQRSSTSRTACSGSRSCSPSSILTFADPRVELLAARARQGRGEDGEVCGEASCRGITWDPRGGVGRLGACVGSMVNWIGYAPPRRWPCSMLLHKSTVLRSVRMLEAESERVLPASENWIALFLSSVQYNCRKCVHVLAAHPSSLAQGFTVSLVFPIEIRSPKVHWRPM
jgi:hypothetical protein